MNTNASISRRNFIAGTAASAAIAATAVAPAVAEEATSWDEEFDVVIVGAGAAGLASAITVATEGNGESVLLCEKGASAGGNSQFCYGDSSWTTVPDDYYTYLKNLAGEHTTTPDDVLHTFADGLGWVKDWIVSLGALEEEMDILPNGTADNPVCNDDVVWPELEGAYAHGMFTIGGIRRSQPDYKLQGASHIYIFLRDIVEAHADQIDFRYECAFESLIQEADGSISGAVIDGKRVKANKGVIMCCGGYENDPDYKENFIGCATAVPVAATLNTGDGHRACAKVGAGFWHMSGIAGIWMQPRDLANTRFTSQVVGGPKIKQYGITVGKNGRRFYMDFDALSCNGGMPYLSDLRTNVGVRYGHRNFGGEWPWFQMPAGGAWFIFDQPGLEAGAIPADDSADPVADGIAYKADTIEELAETIGVPSEELVATVAEWNTYCEDGQDKAFYRPESTLNPVATAPFYAQFCAPTILNTDGGPKRSARAEILDSFDQPIPNLYSAGEFGSVWGHFYQGSGNIAECLIFGRIAAHSCMGTEIKQ